jgi:hypothetical protein
MEKIQFDDGVKTYKAGGGVLRFNPSDPKLYTRFLEVAESLQTIAPKNTEEADTSLRQALEKVFPGNDWSKIFPGSLMALCGNGKLLIVNFLEAIEPVLVAGARKYAQM